MKQECNWIAYAWPKVWNTTGIRCFVEDQACETTTAANVKDFAAKETPFYDGKTQRPSYKAAMPREEKTDSLHFQPLAIGDVRSVDGQIWTPG